jgi:hypothetical protein
VSCCGIPSNSGDEKSNKKSEDGMSYNKWVIILILVYSLVYGLITVAEEGWQDGWKFGQEKANRDFRR